MKFKNLLILTSLLTLAFGVGFVLIPGSVLSLYGIDSDTGVNIIARAYGGALIAIGLLTWFSRDVDDSAALRAMQLAFMIAFAINTIVAIQATVSGGMNALGWSAVIIYLGLSAGYAYFYFAQPEDND